jgi:exopolysaccharide/PEP-CTERM locus tyrosine autokinase
MASTSKTLDIDLARLEELGFVTLTTARRKINEEYREIKRKLLNNAFGPLSKTLPNSNIIMVSSARPSEGKTFTAVNLALSIAAEQDKTVLLVDADVLKPNVLRTFGLEDEKGLMDYLLGEAGQLSDIIYKTNIPKLRIIPAGSSHHLSTELLASTIMNETVNEFSKRYSDRVVIIDTPPLIGINETAILASFAGQAVVVVEEGRSRLQDIQSSVERLNPDMAIGFVVNKSITGSESGGYYGYGYYGEDTEKE